MAKRVLHRKFIYSIHDEVGWVIELSVLSKEVSIFISPLVIECLIQTRQDWIPILEKGIGFKCVTMKKLSTQGVGRCGGEALVNWSRLYSFSQDNKQRKIKRIGCVWSIYECCCGWTTRKRDDGEYGTRIVRELCFKIDRTGGAFNLVILSVVRSQHPFWVAAFPLIGGRLGRSVGRSLTRRHCALLFLPLLLLLAGELGWTE